MAISFSSLSGGGSGGAQVFPIGAGMTLAEQVFAPGFYAFEATSDSAVQIAGTISFYDSNNNLLAQGSLQDSDTTNLPSSAYVGILLSSEAAQLKCDFNDTNGTLTMSYSALEGVKRIIAIKTSQTGFVLPFDATAFIFGGGGSGAGSFSPNDSGGGGGGSGYLTIQAVSAGTYDVVVGAGGPGPGIGDGIAGGQSSFGVYTAAGGFGGVGGGANGGPGGNGGSGGGAGQAAAEGGAVTLGGFNGTNGGSTATQAGGTGSGVTVGFLPKTPTQPEAITGYVGPFYAGGNGGTSSNANGLNAAANSASGGGGGHRGSSNRSGGAGGSGVIYLVEA